MSGCRHAFRFLSARAVAVGGATNAKMSAEIVLDDGDDLSPEVRRLMQLAESGDEDAFASHLDAAHGELKSMRAPPD